MYKNISMLPFMCGLFDSLEKVFYWSLAIVVVGFIGFFLVKSSAFRKFCLGFLCFLIMVAGVISGVNLNKYYNTSGGIIGKLSQYFNPNYVEIETRDEIIFNFKSVMLTQVDGDKYRAEFETSDFIELSPNEAYAVFVNDTPCELIEYGENYTSDSISSDYVISEFYYAFFDESLDYILKDKLTFRFAFYKNSTKLIVETIGGDDAVSLWNSYFQRNDFILKIKPMEHIYMASYSTINIYDGEEVVSSIKIKDGSSYTLPESFSKKGFKFMGYSLDGTNLISDTSFVISDDVKIYAIFKEATYIRFNYKINADDLNKNIYKIITYVDGDNIGELAPANPIRHNFTFLGWSLDGENIIDLNTLYNDGSITNIYGVWQAEAIDINFVLNGGSITIGDTTYNEDFVLTYKFDEQILLSNPAKENYVFDYYNLVLVDENATHYQVNSVDFGLSLNDVVEDINSSFINGLPPIRDDDLMEENELKNVYDLTSVELVVKFITNSDNPSSLSDDDLLYYLIRKSDLFRYDNSSCDQAVISAYCEVVGISYSSCDKSIYEILVFFNGVLNYDIEITEETTSRDYLELEYMSIWTAENQSAE